MYISWLPLLLIYYEFVTKYVVFTSSYMPRKLSIRVWETQKPEPYSVGYGFILAYCEQLVSTVFYVFYEK